MLQLLFTWSLDILSKVNLSRKGRRTEILTRGCHYFDFNASGRLRTRVYLPHWLYRLISHQASLVVCLHNKFINYPHQSYKMKLAIIQGGIFQPTECINLLGEILRNLFNLSA